MKRRVYSGYAISTGFMIYDGCGIMVKTKRYEPEKTGKKLKIILWAVFIGGTWAGMFFLFNKLGLGFLLWQIVVFIGVALFAVMVMWRALVVMLGSIFRPFLIKRRDERVRKILLQFREKQPEKWQATAEYHACEHKLIRLLEDGKPVNLYSLRITSPFIPACGSGKNQGLILASPSLDKLIETLEVAREYFRRVAQQEKQSP